MLKSIAMIVLFAVFSLCGNSFAVHLKRRIEGIEELLAGVRGLGTLMRYQRKPLSELIHQLNMQRDCVLWKELAVLLQYCGFCDAWEQALNTASGKEIRIAALAAPELAIMLDLAKELGRSDFISQQRQLKLAESSLEEILSTAADKQQRCAKLYRTLGISFGIVCAVLIW